MRLLGRFWLQWLGRCVVVGVAALILAVPGRADVLDDLKAPMLMLEGSGAMTPAVMTATQLSIDVAGDAAEAVIEQAFLNPDADWHNALYAMPVPDQAAVRGLVIEFDGRRIVGEIAERAEARAEFEQAMEEGRRATLLEQISADLFHLRVANIPPGGVVKVKVTLTLPVSRSEEWLSLRFPTTLTPRYRMRAPEHGERKRPAVTAAPISFAHWFDWQDTTPVAGERGVAVPWRTAAPVIDHPLVWQVRLRAHGEVASVLTPFHASQVRWRGRDLEITPAAGPASMDRDFVLRWRLKALAAPEPSLLLADHEGEWFAELAVLPPDPGYVQASPPREVVLVLDISGSMAGTSIRQAVAAASAAIASLRPVDRFELIVFESQTFSLFGDLVDVTPANHTKAQRFLQQLEAEGGTEMLPALDRALALSPPDASVLRQILFITDGAVDGERELFGLLQRKRGKSRLFTVAIGSAPNTRFMRRAAELGRGLHRHIGDVNQVEPVLDELMELMAAPVLTDIEIDWPMAVEPATGVPGDLYRGQPVRQRVRLLDPPVGGWVTVRGQSAGVPWDVSMPVTLSRGGRVSGSAMAARWARDRIDSLLDAALLSGAGETSVREPVLSLGLDYQLVTPFTSFVATEQVVSRPAGAEASDWQIPALPPAGQLRFAQTATHARLWLYLAVALLLSAAVFWSMTREEVKRDASPVI